jgi:hypothetical protein
MSSAKPETVALVIRRAASAKSMWLDVAGTSMGSAIVTGDEVQVVIAERPHQGEVWAFCNASTSIVVHRCRGRRSEGWLFEGDAVGQADPVVPASWLIGRVVSIRHHGVERRVGRRDRLLGTFAIALRRTQRALRRSLLRACRRGGY